MGAITIMDRYPLTLPIFVLIFVSVQLGMMNLILAAIVDRANQAHQDDERYLQRQRQHDFARARIRLLELCRSLDQDKAGSLSIDEIRKGFESSADFADSMRLMDVRQDDVGILFEIMDEDGSGDV